MSESSRFCSIRKIRSCFLSPEKLEMLRSSAIACSSATDFRFSSAMSTWGDGPGRGAHDWKRDARSANGGALRYLGISDAGRRTGRERPWRRRKDGKAYEGSEAGKHGQDASRHNRITGVRNRHASYPGERHARRND